MGAMDDKVMNVMSRGKLLECHDLLFIKDSGKEKKKKQVPPGKISQEALVWYPSKNYRFN